MTAYDCPYCHAPHPFTRLDNIRQDGPDCRAYRAAQVPEAERGKGRDDDPRHDAWQGEVIRMAREADPGCMFYHTKDSRGSKAGFQDVFFLLLGQARAIAVECKVGKDKAKPEQLQWKMGMQRCGIESYVLYPSDRDRWAKILSSREAAREEMQG